MTVVPNLESVFCYPRGRSRRLAAGALCESVEGLLDLQRVPPTHRWTCGAAEKALPNKAQFCPPGECVAV
jgi:hypothetical protein